MKRSFALVLSFILSLGLAVPVYAEEALLPEQTVMLPSQADTSEVNDVLLGTETTVSSAELPATAQANLANGKEITDENIREILYGLKAEYPEGRSWTNDDSYSSNAIFHSGQGCAAFALICSDAVFGNLPVREHTDFDAIRVGDMVRIKHNTHTVVVLEKHSNSIVVTEGNYNRSIHWGRKLNRSQVVDEEFFVLTRYPRTKKLTLSQATCTLKPGELTVLFLAIESDNAAAVPLWTSSDRGTVDVDSVGWIRAVREGTATITARVGELNVSCVVTVAANPSAIMQ